MTTCLYIASPSYSGSTLLTMLLAQCSQVATIGEMKGSQQDLATYRCSCGVLFVECAFWRDLIARLGARGFRYDLGDRRTMPSFRAHFSRMADRVLRRPFGPGWLEAGREAVIAAWPRLGRELRYQLAYNEAFITDVLALAGGRVFVDASKDAVRIKYLARIPSLDVRVVQLVRDGRAVTNSSRKNGGIPAEAAAAEWRDIHREIERVARRCCGGRLLRLRYEDLCRDPATSIREVLRFASLDGEPAAAVVDGSGLHVLGNRMRLMGTQAVRVDESWRTELPPGDVETFERVAGALNQRYGYSDAAMSPACTSTSDR
jgi:hypothetical protein